MRSIVIKILCKVLRYIQLRQISFSLWKLEHGSQRARFLSGKVKISEILANREGTLFL